MSETNQAEFKGWARVEVMGHQSHTGYVTTEAYGAAVLFRIDQPEIPEAEELLTESQWIGNTTLPVGTMVKRGKIEAVSVLVGAGSIYRIIPCTEEVARKADSGEPAPATDLGQTARRESAHSRQCRNAGRYAARGRIRLLRRRSNPRPRVRLPIDGSGRRSSRRGVSMRRQNKTDSKQEKLYNEREDAGLRLDILADGIGCALKRIEGAWGSELTRRIVSFANRELLPAAERAEIANEAYKPYWRRRRRRTGPPPRTGKKKSVPTVKPKQKRRKKDS